MPLKERIGITLYVSGAILVAFSSAFAQHGFSVGTIPDSIGFAIGTLIIPAVIAYAVHGRFRKRPNNDLGFARCIAML